MSAIRRSRSLWVEALETFSEEERALVDFGDTNLFNVLNAVAVLADDKKKQCLQNRWSVKVFGRKIILRDVFSKICIWIQKFKEVADVDVQYDPAHAALPWAGVRLLLQVAISETVVFGAMIDGLEWVMSFLADYAIFENIYLKDPSPAVDRLRDHIIALYSAILLFLAKACHHFNRSTLQKIAKSVVNCDEKTVQAMLSTCHQMNMNAIESARLVDAERQQRVLLAIDRMSATITSEPGRPRNTVTSLERQSAMLQESASPQERKLWEMHNNMPLTVSRISEEMQQLYDNLGEDQRLAIYHWLSVIPYTQHHQNARNGRLQDSGDWIFVHPQFQKWAFSSCSTILWIHGIPGSGKSKLVSRIVDSVLHDNASNRGKAPLAYFYCSNNHAEPERGDPGEILLCIARQLSGVDVTQPVRDATIRKFSQIKKEGVQLRPLSMDETVSLILELTSTSPATIVLDALDECNSERRHELFDALDRIVQESSNVVKILVSSRDDGDVVCQLEQSPNVYISADYNTGDICRFVVHEVSHAIEKKRLLNGRVTEVTRDKIIETLQNGAQGMFRWVSLQLQNLCNQRRIKIEADLLEELGRLPKGLHETYGIIYQQLLDSGKHSRSIGIKILRWLQVAQYPLSTATIKAAVLGSAEARSSDLTTRDLLNMTCNLVVEDTALHCLRYAHTSVLEFLASRPDFSENEAHLMAAERCLEVYSSSLAKISEDPLLLYANSWWPVHYAKVGPDACTDALRQRLLQFCFSGSVVSSAFNEWRMTVTDDSAEIVAATSPFYVACLYGMVEMLEYSTRRLVRMEGFSTTEACHLPGNVYDGYQGIHMAVHRGHYDVVEYLLNHGLSDSLQTNQLRTRQGETVLHVAARCQRPSLINLLIRNGAHPDAVSTNAREAYRESGTVEPRKPKQRAQVFIDPAPRVVFGGSPPRLQSSLGFRQATGGVLSVIDEDSEAALHLTARTGDMECLQVLLRHNADVNVRTTLGSTALHLAVLKRRAAIVAELLHSGANPNEKLTYGRTPLHFAAALGQTEIVPVLLHHGADPNIRDVNMCSAHDLAARYGHTALVESSLPSSMSAGPGLEYDLPQQHSHHVLNDDDFAFNVTEWDDELEIMDKELDENLANWKIDNP